MLEDQLYCTVLYFTVLYCTVQVKTTVCCLDKEARAQYSLKLGVRDGGGRRGTATLNIRVMWS